MSMIYTINHPVFKYQYIFFEDTPYNIDNFDVITFYHCKNAINIKDFKRTSDLTSIITLNLNIETLWENLHHKVRQKIRNAEKCGIKIQIDKNYSEFRELYKNFKRKKGFGSPITLLPSKDNINKYGFLLTSELDGDILSGAQFIHEKDKIIIWSLASKRLESKEIAKKCSYSNHLLIWEAIKYAKQIGVTEWDWAGLFSEERIITDKSKEGPNNFKLSFGGTITTLYNYQKLSKQYELSAKVYNVINKQK